MDGATLAVGLVAGALIAAVTAPVGVSGAVFLLPVQLDVLRVPNPAVTPTNLLFNVVSAPGALWRYHRAGQHPGALTTPMLVGTVPGVVLGAVLRVQVVPDARSFRLVAAAVLLPIGGWLVRRSLRRTTPADPAPRPVTGASIAVAGAVVGVVGGVYGIGGGSILAPLLVARGLPVAKVAPAALASTLVTSLVGALTFAVLATGGDRAAAPDWTLGIACGLGGLVGGYVGAGWHRRLDEARLTGLLGLVALALAAVYLVRGLG
ncbi:sulfite exporter TauE/SafE family protein [Nocardioides humi]|uniref:Probable membrane transporter protein n=1 Tax=Nocardioides humi TaxID=449461 RepID=A0ABN2BPR7_9ACTN|nr:sulfite exporter TauE/SafE family protein [Nocardioides humi]